MAEWLSRLLSAAEWLTPGFFAVSLVAPVGFHFRRRRWAWQGMVLLLAGAALETAGVPMAAFAAGVVVAVASLVLLARWRAEALRVRRAWSERFSAAEPVRLDLPFEGRWKALASGAAIAQNHHLVARDQWFATDWVRVDAASFGSRILAPVDGLVAYVEDGHPDKPPRRWVQPDPTHPAGNYVALRIEGREDCCVILAHLGQASIQVQVGQRVKAGEPLARCGNSGNTTVSHLHVHVQPAERVQPGAVWGIPAVFGAAREGPVPGSIAESRFSTETA